MQIKKRIVLVSSGQPSANPRIVKEATALAESGYSIKVIYCPLSPWADEYDKALFKSHPQIEWIKAGYHPANDTWQYRYARVRQKFYHYLYSLVGNRFDASIRSMVLYSQELTREAGKHGADLYIGHNLGALPAVVRAAQNNAAFASFDFEDFHRGEDAVNSRHWNKTKQVEEIYVPLLVFATTASPLITREYQSLFPGLSFTTINNCFPVSYAVSEPGSIPVKPLKLFWFSQTIGATRGLETVIEAMGEIGKGKTELCLLGNCPGETKKYFIGIMKNNGLDIEDVKFLPAIEEKEIVAIAAMHHIGLACELPHILNREFCLTNKVFMYLLAANAVVFSSTKAQSLFLLNHPGIGVSYDPHDAVQLAIILNNYINDPVMLQQHRVASLQLGTNQMNWEIEKQILLQKIKKELNQG